MGWVCLEQFQFPCRDVQTGEDPCQAVSGFHCACFLYQQGRRLWNRRYLQSGGYHVGAACRFELRGNLVENGFGGETVVCVVFTEFCDDE